MAHRPPGGAAARPSVVRAAGVLPWRRNADGEIEVALVHRTRYDDWSWPKGKLDPGEDWAAAAARETFEETGLRVRLGPPLPTAEYPLPRGNGRDVVKQVRYWAGTPVGGHGRLEHEVDEVAWLRLEAASDRLTYPRDRDQLAALGGLALTRRLETWPLILVRHAVSVPRGQWKEEDALRPLTAVGRRRALRMVPLLGGYAPSRLLTSPAVRCADTMTPYAEEHRLALERKDWLSEEAHEARPGRTRRHLHKVLERGEAAALCTHRPLLPELLEQLAAHSFRRLESESLQRLAASGLDKGEALACTMVGAGDEATVLAVTRHRPPR